MSKWIRLIHDDRKKETEKDGFTYQCPYGHSWFVTFKEMNSPGFISANNVCPSCNNE